MKQAILALLLVLGLAPTWFSQATADEQPSAEAKASGQEEQSIRRRRPEIEEIVVTAEKRETNLQDTALSISAFSGPALDAAGIENIEDLTFSVPNFHFGRSVTGPLGQGGITIRGISSGGGDASTAFHLDGVYQNSPATVEGLTFFDVKRVEVLRGPQGTLYGRNATGGSVNVISNPPTEELGAYLDAQFGNYDQIRTRGFLNVPLLTDRILSRVSFFQEVRDGYQKNLDSGVRNDDADDARDVAVRTQLLFNLRDDMDLTVRGFYAERGGVGPALKIVGDLPSEIYLNPDSLPLDLYGDNGASPNPSDPRKIRLDFVGSQDTSQWGINAAYNWDLVNLPLLGDARLTLIGSYLNGRENRVFDADLSDIPLLVIGYDSPVTEWVTEMRLASVGGDPVEWVAGLFYLNSSEDITITGRSFPFSSNPPGENDLELTTEQITERTAQSIAGFGQASYSFWERWRATGGLRYSYDYKEATFEQPPVFLFPGSDEPFIAGQTADDDSSWGAVTGKVGLDWFWRDGSLAYFSFSRGYKAGYINTAPELDPQTGQPIGTTIGNADPEFINAVEVGSKNLLWENRLQLNLTGFYYDYDDLQVSSIAENTVVVQNAAEATIWGFEGEVTVLPIDGLTLVGNASYLNAKYDDFTGFREEDRFQTPVDFSGNTLSRAPPYSGMIAAEYAWDLDRWGVLSPRVQFFGSGDVYFRAANDSNEKQDAYTKTDLRLAWRDDTGRLSVEAFADNVTDEDVILSQVIGTNINGWPVTTVFDAPRTFGVRFGGRW